MSEHTKIYGNTNIDFSLLTKGDVFKIADIMKFFEFNNMMPGEKLIMCKESLEGRRGKEYGITIESSDTEWDNSDAEGEAQEKSHRVCRLNDLDNRVSSTL